MQYYQDYDGSILAIEKYKAAIETHHHQEDEAMMVMAHVAPSY